MNQLYGITTRYKTQVTLPQALTDNNIYSARYYYRLKQIDLNGTFTYSNEVATLVDEYKPAGNYEVSFEASSAGGGLSSGIYLYKLRVGTFFDMKKMILIK